MAGTYAEQVRELIKTYTDVYNNRDKYRPEALDKLKNQIISGLSELYKVSNEYYSNVDWSYFSTNQLKQILEQYACWGNYGLEDKDKNLKPANIVKQVTEELAKRK